MLRSNRDGVITNITFQMGVFPISIELKLSVSGKHQIERFLSLLQVGILTAIEKNIVSIEEAEGYIFNPYSVERLEKMGIDRKVVDIIRHGCELEDVKSLVPDKLKSTVRNLKEQALTTLKATQSPELPVEKLIK